MQSRFGGSDDSVQEVHKCNQGLPGSTEGENGFQIRTRGCQCEKMFLDVYLLDTIRVVSKKLAHYY